MRVAGAIIFYKNFRVFLMTTNVEDAGWMCSPMICEHCGKEWQAVHPICEWVQCECGQWAQVPPADEISLDNE